MKAAIKRKWGLLRKLEGNAALAAGDAIIRL